MIKAKLMTLLLMFTLLAACSAPKVPPHATGSSPPAATNRSAVIAPGDRLHVSVFELVDVGMYFNTETRVDDLGDIELPNVGRIHVADLTPVQAAEKISQKASFDALHGIQPASGPEVHVEIISTILPGEFRSH